MKNWLGVVAVFLAAILFSGCSKKAESVSSENSATNYPLPDPPLVADCNPGIRGGRLVIAEPGDPKTFNPITANESSSQDIYRFFFASLLGDDPVAQGVTPGLAYEWTNLPDGRTWTFKLRKNLFWSDGQPLTADDVVFTCNDLIYNTNINPVMADALQVDGKNFVVTKIDDWTVQVVTPEIYAPFLEAFGAGVPIMPKHILEKTVADGTFNSAYGINWKSEDIICSGPYKIRQYESGDHILLERNPYFCETDTNGTRLPYFDNIVFTIVPDRSAISLRFLSGECDVHDFIYADEYDKFKAKSANGKFNLLEPGIGLETDFFWFNENTGTNKDGKPIVDPKKLKWFRNEKFRQACAYAIDRDAIIKSVFSGRAIPNCGFVTPGNKKWFNPNTAQYSYNLAKARELLKEIGIEDRDGDGILEDADGNKIEFVFNTNIENNSRNKAAVLIQADLQKLGFKVVFQPVEFNTLVHKIDDTYDYDCVLMGLAGGGADPAFQANVLKSSGFTHQWFPRQKAPSTEWEARIDQLMDAQVKTLDFAERKKDFDEVQQILAEEQPMIFTVTPYYYAAARADIGNLKPTALSYYRVSWNAEELYFKK
ncbi:MAG TPA: ABC transporter substrate-binding protein [Verrucomicrobiae bacterium]|nr:ABC transporter substrate-binding protein [Verrucomicrobiae bacterium]